MTDFNPEVPYNDLPALPPPADQIETTQILKRCIESRVALAELKQSILQKAFAGELTADAVQQQVN